MTTPTSTLTIERITAETVADVLPLLSVQFEEHAIPVRSEQLERAVRGLVESPGRGAVLVARDGAEAVGVAVLAHTWTLEHGGLCTWLDELYVVPERRGAGIGSALLRVAIDVAKREGCAAVDLEVDAKHARAERLYLREGFSRRARQRFWRSLSEPVAP